MRRGIIESGTGKDGTMEQFNFIATTTFGLEATVKREVTRLGFANVAARDGRVDFTAGPEAFARANINMRGAGRLLLKMGAFTALTFDELFEKTKSLPWGDWITKDGKFTVTGKSVKSKLFSVPDCQAIVKKAIVEKLKQKYGVSWFEETGPEYKVQASLLKDEATLTIDTSGSGLHKRGYRETGGGAPLKETMAAALVELSYWRKNRVLLDPVCGSGTIPIEAALIARNIAPGLRRSFACEGWPQIDARLWKEARREAYAAIDTSITPEIYGSDIDPAAVALAKNNARKAGVDDCIRFETKALADVSLPASYGVAICNPPYGERMGERADVTALYRDMRRLFGGDGTWSVYVLTSDGDFEKYYGRSADAKRKLFNGMIKTDYYQFHGERPPALI